MHETRNFLLVLLLLAAAVWAFLAWLVFDPEAARAITVQRTLSVLAMLGLGAWLFYALVIEDKLPDHLQQTVGPFYYESDGVSFMPTVRVRGDQAELSVYYQNRYENPVDMIIHLRLPEETFLVHESARAVNIAFRCGGGDFGVIHQPIAVPDRVQGEVVTVLLAANTYYPRSHGACWRRKGGLPCGTLPIDWSGSAFKSGVHEASSEVELTGPIELHLAMPTDVKREPDRGAIWRQEVIQSGDRVSQSGLAAT